MLLVRHELSASSAIDETALLVQAGLHQWSIPYTPLQIDQFVVYRDMLIDWNSRFNLTRILSPVDIATEHFLDSLALLAVINIRRSSTLLDIGPGAGFPSLPLKIVRPDLKLALVEATAKKLTFCQAVVDEFALANVRLIHGRADQRLPGLRRSFDIVTARAIAPLADIVAMAEPYLKPSGLIAAYKGTRAFEELRDAQPILERLNMSALVRTIAVPKSNRTHSIIICRHLETGATAPSLPSRRR